MLRKVALDAIDPRTVAKFHRQLLGLRYPAGDESPPDGEPDPQGKDSLCLRDVDRSDADEPLRVYADPAGHPFCVFVGD